MTRFIAVLMLGLLAALPLRAQGSAEAQAGIEGTIRSQIQAFEADDFARAFTFASPSIQRLFGTPENFGTMVRRGYPMVWRPGEVRFGELRDINGALWQKVIIQDQDGVTHVLAYRMIQQNGEWLISGVQILQQPEVAA